MAVRQNRMGYDSLAEGLIIMTDSWDVLKIDVFSLLY